MLQSLASASSRHLSSVALTRVHSKLCRFALSELETLEQSSTTAPQQVPIKAPQQVPTAYAQQQLKPTMAGSGGLCDCVSCGSSAVVSRLPVLNALESLSRGSLQLRVALFIPGDQVALFIPGDHEAPAQIHTRASCGFV